MIQTQNRSLKQLFKDDNYAWQLLECQVKIQTSIEIENEDLSHLLQLYMKGVQKMNSYLDIRQAYFKERVMTLMSRPQVMKSLNNSAKKIMSKKKIPTEGTAEKQQNSQTQISPKQKNSQQMRQKNQKQNFNMQNQKKPELLQLKQKKRQLEVRLAYGNDQNSHEALQKMLCQQNNKQTRLSQKIIKIVQNHEQNLAKRIKQRKLKTSAARSLSNALMDNSLMGSKRQIIVNENGKIQQTFGSYDNIQYREQKIQLRRRCRSWSPKRSKSTSPQNSSPIRKSVSYQVPLIQKKEIQNQLMLRQ